MNIKLTYMEKAFLLGIFAIALVLFLCNLGNQYFWQDEAQTALISKTILTHGIPLGSDGKNSFSAELGAEYGKNYVWRWHTWLPFYVTAGFFALFGVSTFVARVPFALFGIASVFMTYAFCKTLWQDRKIAYIAAFLLVISVPFLLLSRECRYYSMATFFSLAGLYFYIGILEQRKYAPLAFFLSLVLLFHTHYIYCATLLASVIVHCSLFNRNRLSSVLLLSAAVVLVNIPWIIWLSGMKYGPRYGVELFQIKTIATCAATHLYKVSKYIFSPFLLLIIPLSAIGNRIRTGSFFFHDKPFWQRLTLLLFFIFFNFVAVILSTTFPFFRYLTPLIPILIILIAVLVIDATRLHLIVAIGVVILLIYSGVLSYFVYELTHDYHGPTEGIVKYLNRNGSKNDTVVITYGDMALKFYTPMRIIGAPSNKDIAAATKADWLILRKYTVTERDKVVKDYLLKNVQWANYKKIEIDYPDIPFENREEIRGHQFKTVVAEDRVVIFQKIR